MTASDLIDLIKSGKTEFFQIDVEGTLINVNLSCLYFEECFFVVDFSGSNLSNTVFFQCNLKTCDFSYCNLDYSEFRDNCLDSTEFKFTQYTNLSFEGNSAYGGKFSKEILEDIRFTNHPGFHISCVDAGWFRIILADKDQFLAFTASNYLGHDAPRELLTVIIDLCLEESNSTSVTKWMSWNDEPGTYIWKFVRQSSLIKFTVYCSETIPKDKQRLDKEQIRSINFDAAGDFFGFANELARSFDKILEYNSVSKYYEKAWGKFPHAELNQLNSLIRANKLGV
jgi:hypothetical protein